MQWVSSNNSSMLPYFWPILFSPILALLKHFFQLLVIWEKKAESSNSKIGIIGTLSGWGWQQIWLQEMLAEFHHNYVINLSLLFGYGDSKIRTLPDMMNHSVHWIRYSFESFPIERRKDPWNSPLGRALFPIKSQRQLWNHGRRPLQDLCCTLPLMQMEPDLDCERLMERVSWPVSVLINYASV